MTMGSLRIAGVLIAAATIGASIPAKAQDDDGEMRRPMEHRMMRHEMHREMRRHMMHRMMRHEMRREMRHEDADD